MFADGDDARLSVDGGDTPRTARGLIGEIVVGACEGNVGKAEIVLADGDDARLPVDGGDTARTARRLIGEIVVGACEGDVGKA